ncbi:MAG: MFS transporter [Pseudomonadota bacterium]
MDDARVLDSAYAWRRLGLTLLAGVVGNIGMWSIIVVMPAIEAEFGTDRGAASLPYTLTMIGFAFGNLLIGRAVDRYGIAASLAAASLFVAIGFALAAVAPSMGFLTAAQFIIGFGAAASFGPLIADISHWFRRRRGIAVAVAASGNYLSGAIWPMLLSGLLAAEGWRAVYGVLAALTLLSMLPMAAGLRRRLRLTVEAAAAQAAEVAARSAGFRPAGLQILLMLAGLGCCIAMSMPQVHIVSLCVDLGYGPAVGAEMLSLMLLGGVVSRLVSGMLADVLGGVRTLLIGSALQCLALFLYLPFDAMLSLYIVSLVFGLSQGGIVPSYALIVREYMPAEEAGTRVGLVITATILGMALGGWISGEIFDLTGSYQMALLHGIMWNALNIGIMLLILTRSGGRHKAVAA